MLACLALGACGIVGSKSEDVTAGAIRAAKQEVGQVDPTVVGPIAERNARGVVVGTLSQLGGDTESQSFRDLVASSAAAAVGGIAFQDRAAVGQIANLAAANAIDAFARELGADGALRGNMSLATRELSASAIAGARDELRGLVPSCPGDEPNCVERRLVELSRQVSRGIARGVADELRLGVLVLAFLGGVTITLIVLAFMRLGRTAH